MVKETVIISHLPSKSIPIIDSEKASYITDPHKISCGIVCKEQRSDLQMTSFAVKVK